MEEPDAWKAFIDSTGLSQSMHCAFTWGVVTGNSTSNDIWPRRNQATSDIYQLRYVCRHLISSRASSDLALALELTVVMIHILFGQERAGRRLALLVWKVRLGYLKP